MDTKVAALKSLQSAFGIFRKDLEALPEEAFAKKFGPKTRTVADIVYEVNLVNDHIGMTLRKEPLFEWPSGWITAPADFQTKDVVLAGLEASSQRFLATIEGMTEEQWTAVVTTERGETDANERCRFVCLHLWYHSGQFNFIQTLLGDDQWHW